MICPNDGIDNREGAKRCKKCGACLNCGQKDPGEKICRKCRIPLSESAARQCAKGHSLPAGSDRCDICEGMARPGMDTGAGRARQDFASGGPRKREPTEIDEPATGTPPPPRPSLPRVDSPRRPVTQFPNARKIVGLLITYTWNQEGDLFALREGRNLIGRDPDCDVCLEADAALGGKHAHITFLKNFMIGDMISRSGTFVDDEPVEQERQQLRNGARVRTGSTVWTFVAIPSGEEAKNAGS